MIFWSRVIVGSSLARFKNSLGADNQGNPLHVRFDLSFYTLNNRAENSHQPTRRRHWPMKRFKSARQVQRFPSVHDPIANLFYLLAIACPPSRTVPFAP